MREESHHYRKNEILSLRFRFPLWGSSCVHFLLFGWLSFLALCLLRNQPLQVTASRGTGRSRKLQADTETWVPNTELVSGRLDHLQSAFSQLHRYICCLEHCTFLFIPLVLVLVSGVYHHLKVVLNPVKMTLKTSHHILYHLYQFSMHQDNRIAYLFK